MRPFSRLQTVIATLAAVVVVLVGLLAMPLPADAVASTETVLTVHVSTHVAKVGQSVSVRGQVTGGARTLLVQQHTADGRWRTVGTTHSSKTGAIAFDLPKHVTGYFGVRRLRVLAPATTTDAVSSKPLGKVKVQSRYQPRGRAKAYALEGYRWNPCGGPIPVYVNLGGKPSRLGLVKNALGRVSRASGLRFRIAGRTAVIPDFRGRMPSYGLVIAFASGAKYPGLQMSTGKPGDYRAIGWGGPDMVSGHQILSASVVVDTSWHWSTKNRFGFNTAGNTLMHEVGHAVGLSHPHGVVQVMSAVDDPRVASNYGAGDLSGLERVGADQGCLR